MTDRGKPLPCREVTSQWTVFYSTEIDSAEVTFGISEYEGSGLVEQARARFLESVAAREFDLDEARHQAPDRIVLGKVIEDLECRRRLRGSGW